METKLNDLYQFILERSMANIPTSVEDICIAFPKYYSLNKKESNYSNSPKVYEDIDTINELNELDSYIIIKDNNNFKIGTKDEVIAYSEKLKKHALKQLKKYWVIVRRIEYKNNMFIDCNKLFNEKAEYDKFVNSFIDELPMMHYDDEYLMKCSLRQLHEYTKSIGGYVCQGWNKQDYINEIRLVERENAKKRKEQL